MLQCIHMCTVYKFCRPVKKIYFFIALRGWHCYISQTLTYCKSFFCITNMAHWHSDHFSNVRSVYPSICLCVCSSVFPFLCVCPSIHHFWMCYPAEVGVTCTLEYSLTHSVLEIKQTLVSFQHLSFSCCLHA